ncbi:hypothetical protein [Halomonas shantousis]
MLQEGPAGNGVAEGVEKAGATGVYPGAGLYRPGPWLGHRHLELGHAQ